ncbi:type II toxin-antitoxin system PemK/MazF family toxin [Sulfurimonas autotrophica]|uniref:mRNA interferase n=1 Tax=Sulfurimonas autotrophica (strain ATCC BAA-671 / DSM 16294 / JCM 11897 / OK10) TaxID=563040 RepID=E0UT73_SULAO|nr:type II toxin-antitoxin system PemK/MazF family toxin [Sulfurimonas autotrophica]ADN08176.1 transcriptional modulator of MazE/toxin, MazF [Sulfurimonas autotrophica DSM 16294]
MFKRGNIYLAKLYPSKGHKVCKTRPVLVLQTNLLNDIGHTTCIILPLTTSLVENSFPLRLRVQLRDKLLKTSEILCDQIRTIDNTRLQSEVITSLSQQELLEIEQRVQIILDFA